jgi:hypothetical protein
VGRERRLSGHAIYTHKVFGTRAIQDIMHLLPSNPREERVATAGPRLDLVHGSRHILDLAQTIARGQ